MYSFFSSEPYIQGGKLTQPAGATLKMRGLPFKASTEEVLKFFRGFSIVPETLQFGWDRYGRPSGEAWIAFQSPEEAQRALRERHRDYIGHRYIELSLK